MNSSDSSHSWLDAPYPLLENTVVEKLQDSEVDAIRQNIRLDTDLTVQRGGLNVDLLAQHGLLPAFVQKENGRPVAYFSRAFSTRHHTACIGYFPNSEGYWVAAFEMGFGEFSHLSEYYQVTLTE